MSIWMTKANELVGIGDAVALGLVEHSDAVGRIIAETDEGDIQCVLVSCRNCSPGKFVVVEEDQLLLKVYR